MVVINTLLGQTPGPLRGNFEVGAHYLHLYEHDREPRQADLLGELFDVRALEAAHGRIDSLGNPDVLIRTDGMDLGAYGDLKYLEPRVGSSLNDPDSSRRVERRLRDAFSQDPRIAVAVVDGRDIGLSIDAAVRGIRRALGYWRHQGRGTTPMQRMIVFVGDGSSVAWQGDTGAINVST